MKRMLTIGGIVALLLLLGVFGLRTVSVLETEITRLTGTGLDACHLTDQAAGLQAVDEIRRLLEEKDGFLRLYIHKSRLDTLEEQLVLAESHLEEGVFPLAAACFHRIAWQMGEILEDELPLPENIL